MRRNSVSVWKASERVPCFRPVLSNYGTQANHFIPSPNRDASPTTHLVWPIRRSYKHERGRRPSAPKVPSMFPPNRTPVARQKAVINFKSAVSTAVKGVCTLHQGSQTVFSVVHIGLTVFIGNKDH